MKGWEPGDRIEWRHFYPDGRSVTRTGIVWDRAPSVAGAIVVAWVVPDAPLPGDLYAAIAVGKANGRTVMAHGKWLDSAAGRQYPAKGEAYASNYAGSPLGALTMGAANHAGRIRRARELVTA